MKRLVLLDEQEFSIPSVILNPQEFEYRSPVVTQVMSKDIKYGSVPRRGASLRAKQVRDASISITLIPLTNSTPDLELLSHMSVKTAILSLDVFGNIDNQPDSYNANASFLSASKGRLSFNAGAYPTSCVQLIITNRQSRNFRLKIQCAVYERE